MIHFVCPAAIIISDVWPRARTNDAGSSSEPHLMPSEQSVENQGKQTSKNAKNQTDMLQDPELIG